MGERGRKVCWWGGAFVRLREASEEFVVGWFGGSGHPFLPVSGVQAALVRQKLDRDFGGRPFDSRHPPPGRN